MKKLQNHIRSQAGNSWFGLLALLVLGLALTLSTGCGDSKTVSADPAAEAAASETVETAEAAKLESSQLTVPDGTILTVRLLQSLSSASARPGDEFDAELADSVSVDGKEVFPKGAQVQGRVVSAKKSGRLQDPGKLGISLKAIQMQDGDWINVTSSTFHVQGGSHKKRNLTIIGGGSGVGALIGGIAGGGKGAAIGAASGAAAGTAGAAATGKKDVMLSSERTVRFTLKNPLTVQYQPGT